MSDASTLATRPGHLALPTRVADRAGKMSRRQYWTRRLWRLRMSVVGLVIVLGMVMVALLAPVISPYDPIKQELGARLVPPIWEAQGRWDHPLGTDRIGRDTV